MSDPFAPELLARLDRPPRRVALVRARRIGDFICATPALRSLRAALPAAEITMIGLPFCASLVERSPSLDRFEPFPGYPGIAEQFFDARAASRFFERMQARRFDLAIQLHGSGVYANPFTLLLGARVTAGFVRPGDTPGRLDAALPFPEALPEGDRLLRFADFLGAPAVDTHTEFPLRPEDRRAAERLLSGAARPLIGLHAGARDAAKRWPTERFAAAGEMLRRRAGGTIVLVGGPEQRATAKQIGAQVGAPSLDLTGRTTLPVLGALIARLAVLVTNDSGPAHIAYALGAPSVTIFGGTSPAIWGPPPGPHRVVAHPVPCRPTTDECCPSCPIDYACLDGIDPAEVVDEAEAVMRTASVSSAA